jgi:hypothetical protein
VRHHISYISGNSAELALNFFLGLQAKISSGNLCFGSGPARYNLLDEHSNFTIFNRRNILFFTPNLLAPLYCYRAIK